jgi:hypothetical protein
MSGFKQMKTAKLGIVLQLTEVASDKEQRLWEVHDVERNRGFRVTLPSRALQEGKKKWSDAEIEGAVGLAIERFLVGSPELTAGPLYEVQVTSRDLQDFASA